MLSSASALLRPLLLALAMGLPAWTAVLAATEWLAVCSQCVSPSVFSKTGIGTDKAVAQARITREAVQEWCASWQPDDKGCLKKQLEAEDLKKVYQASANCPAGRITPIDGQTYTLAGAWDKSDIGAGRSRWRDASGKIVGRDNASGGLGISQQWELLCPGGAKPPKAGAATTAPAGQPAGNAMAAKGAQPAMTAEFAVGQTVMARYNGQWVRARVNALRPQNGPDGMRMGYDVTLDNGKHGVVPARMLRAAP